MKSRLNNLVIPLLFLFSPCGVHSATLYQPSKTFQFNKGLNNKDIPTAIDDAESPDESNFISDDGSSYVRNGTRRFNTTALSTNPITGMVKGYSMSGKSAFIVTSADKIYVSTFAAAVAEDVYFDNNSTATIFVSTYTSSNRVPNRLLIPNQRFSFETINNSIYMVNGSTWPLKYNIDAGSISIVASTPPIAKFILQTGDYTLLARTTDFPNRVFFSDVANPESWPAGNYFDLETRTGDVITGMAHAQDGDKIFTNDSIWNLVYVVLSNKADRNYTVYKKLNKVGCIAPYSIANFGDGIFFLARDGFRILVGGTSVIVSDKVRTKIAMKLVSNGRYQNVIAMFDKKNKWIWVSYEDPSKYPKGVNNKVIIYDLRLGQWYPIDGINASAFCAWEGPADNNELFAGDSIDGYVYEMDVPLSNIDARTEVSLSNFDSDFIYESGGGCPSDANNNVSRDSVTFVEGNRAIRIQRIGAGNPVVTCFSSVFANNMTTFFDKSPISPSDYIQFKFRRENRNTDQTIKWSLYFTPDLIFPAVNQYQYSLDLTDSELGGAASLGDWATVKVRISSFVPISGIIPNISQAFNRSIALMSWQLNGTNTTGFWIDDLRVVKGSPNTIIAHRYTKPFDLGFKNKKTWNKVLLTAQMNPEAQVKVDLIDSFGRQVITRPLNGGYSDFIYISSGQVFRKLNKSDYTVVKDSSILAGSELNDLVPTPNFLYGLNRSTGILFKIDLSSMGLLAQTSTFASGNNFPNSYGLTFQNGIISVLQMLGSRVIQFDENLVFISSYALFVSSPTGIATDSSYNYILDSGSKTISMFDSSYNLINRRLFSNVDLNGTFGGGIALNQNVLLTSYKRPPDSPYFSFSSATIIQLRDKFSLSILKEINIVNGTDNTIPLAVNMDNTFLYIAISSPTFLQKYYIDDLKFINQVNLGTLNGLGVNSYFVDLDVKEIPISLSSRYLQLHYRVDHAFDRLRIFDQTFGVAIEEWR